MNKKIQPGTLILYTPTATWGVVLYFECSVSNGDYYRVYWSDDSEYSSMTDRDLQNKLCMEIYEV